MQLGILISTTGLKVGSFRVGAEIAADMGYDSVELGMNRAGGEAPTADLGVCSLEEAQFLADDVRAAGVDISALQCHTNFVSPDPEVVAANVDLTRRAIDYAADMAVPFVHTVSGPLAEGADPSDAWAALLQAYNVLLEHAAYTPVQLGIEPVFAYLVGNADTTRYLLEHLGREDLAINFDPSHFPFHRESSVAFLGEFGDRILHAHVKDAVVEPMPGPEPGPHAWPMPTPAGNGPEQFRFAAPGHGCIDWSAVVAGLREQGYDNVLSLELGHGIEDEEQAARDNVTFFRRLLGQV